MSRVLGESPISMYVVAALILVFPSTGLADDFHGYPCTEDCSGHEAGYQWAEDNGITSADDCSGNSQSFIEGCMAYTEEMNGYDEDEDSDDEGDGDEDPD